MIKRQLRLGCGLGLVLAAAAPAGAVDMTSASFAVRWHTTSSAGGASASAGFVVTDTVGQSLPTGPSGSASFSLQAGFETLPDSEADGVKDFMDNCLLSSNLDQRDSDGDGFGNACDPDLNGDGVVNFADLGILKSVFFTTDPDADLNGDGVVNFGDLGIMKSMFFAPPGPSGIVP